MGLAAQLRLVKAAEDVAVAASRPQVQPYAALRGVDVRTMPTDAQIFGGTARDLAMSIPAFRQGVNLIAGTCGTFPVTVTDRDFNPLPVPNILAQPDPDEPPSVTWTKVFADLVLHPYAWLMVTARFADGFPYSAIHVPSEQVSVTEERVWWEGEDWTDNAIRFDSPNAPGALYDGQRILTTSLLIEDAVRRYARMDIPSGYLKQTGGPEITGEEIDSLLDAWEAARQTRTTGFLNATVDYAQTAFDAAQLQLVEARAANAVDIARLLNLPPVFVNAESGGSLTYATTESQARALLNTSLVPYLAAWRGRVSMGDVTPRGQTVRHNLDAFLRGDLQTRATAYSTLLTSGVLTVDEVRRLEELPPMGSPA